MRCHLSDWLRVKGGLSEVSDRSLGFSSFLQAVAGLGLFRVRALRRFGCFRARALRGLIPVLLGALLLGRFATVQVLVLVLLEGQQVGLLLLQLPLELLCLPLLLKLPPFILLSAGRVKLNQSR